jgi:hypothetical protein
MLALCHLIVHQSLVLIDPYLTPGMPILPEPCVSRLIPTHGNLCVSGSIHGPLVYVRRAHHHQLIIYNHAFGMHVYHHPSINLRKSLRLKPCRKRFRALRDES